MVSHVSLTVATMYFQVNPLSSNFCMIINIYLIFLDKCVAFVVVLKKKKEHKNLTVRKIKIMSLQFTQEIARTFSGNPTAIVNKQNPKYP